MRAPDSRAVIEASSSSVSLRDVAAKFSRIREGSTDLGITMLPAARCHASTTWAVVASCAWAAAVTAFWVYQVGDLGATAVWNPAGTQDYSAPGR